MNEALDPNAAQRQVQAQQQWQAHVHHDIDDASLEKASITWYFHNGKCLRLQGAD